MIRKFVLLLVMLLALPFVPVSAVDVTSGPLAMAQYAPSFTTVFIAMRIDDGYLDEIQSVVDRIQTHLPAEFNLPPLQLRQSLMNLFDGSASPVSYDDLRAALGEHVAIATLNPRTMFASGLSDAGLTLAVEVGDRAKLEDLLMLAPVTKETDADGYSRYTGSDTSIALNDTIMIMASKRELLAMVLDDRLLSESNAYTDTMQALPADSYNAVIYFGAARLLPALPESQALLAAGISADEVGLFGIGLTILDERTLVVDVVQNAATPPLIENIAVTPVDAAFASRLPASADMMLQGVNLGSYIGMLLKLLDAAGAQQSSPPSGQITGLIGVTGLDFQRDILDASTGNFAVFSSIDGTELAAILADQDVAGGLASLTGTLPRTGMLVEMQDAAAAATLAERISIFMKAAIAPDSGTVVSDKTVNGVNVVSIQVNSSPLSAEPIEFMIGADDTLFFVANAAAVEAMTGDGAKLADDALFHDAQTYVLPDAAQLWYISGEGLVGGLIMPAAAVTAYEDDEDEDSFQSMPVATSIFLEATPVGATPAPEPKLVPTPTGLPTPLPIETPRMRNFLLAQTALDVIESATISTVYTGDTRLVRLALTLK